MTNYERDLLIAFNKREELLQIKASNSEKVLAEYYKAQNEYIGMLLIVDSIKNNPNAICLYSPSSKWDNIEVHGVTMGWSKDSGGQFSTFCEPTDDPERIYFYSVYLHQVEGGNIWIADFLTEELANRLADLLELSIKNYVDNGHLNVYNFKNR